jgi:hypothetical protein
MYVDPNVMHICRSFVDTYMEDNCDCPVAACGHVVSIPEYTDNCQQHGMRYSKTMRRTHWGSACPDKPSNPDGRENPFPMPSVFIDRVTAHNVLEAFRVSDDFQGYEFDLLIVESVRRLASVLGLDPNHYTPHRNRYQVPHTWSPDEDAVQLCDWCGKPAYVLTHLKYGKKQP